MSRSVQSTLDAHSQKMHEAQAQEFLHLIQDRLGDYELMLKGARAVAAMRGGVDRVFWRAYVDHLDLRRQHPGVLGISYAPLVPVERRREAVSRMRADWGPGLSIWPETQGVSAPVACMEPLDADNRRAIGYDLYSEQTRREALERAAETGLATITGRLNLVQDARAPEQGGFLMCLPVYASDAPVLTPAEKRRALTGFVTGAFRMRDFMRSLAERAPRNASFTLYDGGRADGEHLCFASAKLDDGPRGGCIVQSTRVLEVLGRPWTLRIRSRHLADSVFERQASALVLGGGLTISLLLTLVPLTLRRTWSRAGKLAQDMTAALRESVEQKRQLFDNAPIGIYQTTPEGRILSANPYLAGLHGYASPSEFMASVNDAGKQLYADPEDRDKMMRELEHGPIARMIVRRLKRDGAPFWVSLSAIGVRDEQGGLVRVEGFLRDDTERVQAEQALEAERLRLSNIIEGTGAGTWEWSVPTGEAVFNQRWSDITGYGLTELTPIRIETWREMMHPDDAVEADMELGRHFRRETDSYDVTFRLRRKDGVWIWAHVRGRVVSWGADGQPLGMSGILTDITESRRTLQALREGEERYKAFFSSTESMRLITDPGDDGRIVDANEAAIQFYGYGQALKGMHVHEINTLPRERVLEELGHAASNIKNLFQFRHRLASGEIRDVEVHISHIQVEGKRLVASSIHDVTELRRLERTKADIEMIMRHDLKAPLSSFVSLPKLMSEDESLGAKHRNALSVLHHTASRMLQQINATLALQKIETGGFTLTVSLCRPVRSVRHNVEILAVCRNMARERVSLVLEDGEFELHTDPMLLDVTLMNILANALEAGGMEDPVRVEVRREGGMAVVSVWNPSPVPLDMRSRFFEKHATSGKVGGTGIGTYSARLMARAMGGSLEMETSDEGGTTVTLRIPDRKPSDG